MKLSDFEAEARRAFEAIPEQYREGIDGLVVSPEAEPHPALPDIYTLGYCDTEAYLSDYQSPETVRSTILLFHGSFRKLAALSEDFDWEAEIEETVEHEVRHHLEYLAGQDDLGGVDYALDESFKRGEGMEWDPWYWQHGDVIGPGTYAAEDQVYVEVELTEAEFREREVVRFRWRGTAYEIDRPDELGDVHFVWVSEGLRKPPPFLELVLVRERSWWEDAKRLFSSSRPRVLESEATARPR